MSRGVFLTGFFWGLFALKLLAQGGPYSFVHYGTEDGLSNDFITAISKDRPGFLWIGTANGLNRFDGRRFRVFRHDPQNAPAAGLPNDYIIGLRTGPDGWLWVSTGQGLCRLEPEHLLIEPVNLSQSRDTSLKPGPVSQVSFDIYGRVWVTDRTHLYCLDLKTGQRHTYDPQIGRPGPYPVYIDRQNTIWLTAESRLFRFDPATKQCFPYFLDPEQSKPIGVMDIGEDKNNDLWFITWGDGLFRYNRQTDQPELITRQVNLTRRILCDTTATGQPFFWLGGGLSGLFLFFPDQKITQEFPNDSRDPYTHNGISATYLFKDERTGDVWIGTEVGLEHYAPTAIRFGRSIIPKEPDFGPYNLVSGAVLDPADSSGQHYFIGVWANSFFRWNRRSGIFERFKRSPKYPDLANEVFSLTAGRDGFIWLNIAGGVNRYDPRTKRLDFYPMPFRKPERANKIMCSLQDRRGVLWFGANAEGLFRLAPTQNRPEHVDLPEELTFPGGGLFIHNMAEDASGRLWMATNRGISCYDPASGTGRRLTVTGLGDDYDCIGITVAHDGHIWATAGTSLIELDASGRVIRRLGPDEGIRCSRVFYLVEDLQGKIWFNGDYLLHCFDPETGTFTYYGKADGLFSNAPTDGLSALPNGEIIIGFQNAFNYFDPARLRRNTTPPPVVITTIRVLNEERALGEPLVLHPGQNMLSVEFAALNFSQPERNRYAYKLEGFDRDWNYTDRPVAIYTNLDGGQHLLRLKAANNDGVWNETGATLSFRVIPPLYQRWYFFAALALFAAGIAFTIARYRYLSRRRLEIFRERLARDLHDEMGSTLSSIRFFSDFAQTQVAGENPEALPVLQRISQSATALSESMQDIVWAMKTRNDRLDDIASRMTEFGLRLLEARGIRFKTRIDEHLRSIRLSPEQRRNLYLIFKEAINNAAKYANCSEVELVFTVNKDNLYFAVCDNGQGFAPASNDAGNGLQNMQQRAAEIGGHLKIVSAPGAGTQVELKVRM